MIDSLVSETFFFSFKRWDIRYDIFPGVLRCKVFWLKRKLFCLWDFKNISAFILKIRPPKITLQKECTVQCFLYYKAKSRLWVMLTPCRRWQWPEKFIYFYRNYFLTSIYSPVSIFTPPKKIFLSNGIFLK